MWRCTILKLYIDFIHWSKFNLTLIACINFEFKSSSTKRAIQFIFLKKRFLIPLFSFYLFLIIFYHILEVFLELMDLVIFLELTLVLKILSPVTAVRPRTRILLMARWQYKTLACCIVIWMQQNRWKYLSKNKPKYHNKLDKFWKI